MSPRSLNVLIADDHAIVRFGLKRLLQDLPNIGNIGEVDNGSDVLAAMRNAHWDLLLLDVDMPGQDSIDVLRHVKTTHPGVAVLVLSMYPEEQFALRMLKAGAAGYLNKQLAPEQLLTAVRRVSEGGAFISADLAAVLASNLKTQPKATLDELLTDREFCVLRGIASGRTVTEIARDLHLSVKTVSTYRTRLLSKLGLHNNIDLARYATTSQLVK